MRGFQESETKSLIEFIKQNEYKGLSNAFKEYAELSGRAKGSVRNYYYKVVNECKNNEKLSKKLGVLEKMYPIFIEEFKESESRELLTLILNGVAEGRSVRSVILALSNNNSKLALRYQNKYRNLLKNRKELVLEVASKIKTKTGESVNPYKSSEKLSEQKKLENQIDSLLKNLYSSLKEENDKLRAKNTLLERENQKLKEVFKKSAQDKNFSREFFLKSNDLSAI